ncbi:hypothetical protein [Rhizorhabdus phycosphaerae]|uniref:hypothetical protein n=1 Tax=Rhizorhabdus phycosphaerae TaxID=2711156 RepID=UPI0019D1DCEB|nr:hypothetical protein [Rhizorhabdus phycosphaerae]
MGRPQHYSLEIATRCQRLIEQLNDKVGEDRRLVDEWGGPLRTTFLLAMSTPMLVLPMERLFRPLFGKGGVASDLELDPILASRVNDTFGHDRAFGEASFFVPDSWAYVAATDIFPVAKTWPQEKFAALSAPEAMIAAASAPAADVLECLRNALSHGGIAYLDVNGQQTDDATDMLAFVARTRDRKALQLLRISVDGYQQFLRCWSNWLSERQVEHGLAEEGPGWFNLDRAEPLNGS